jgi:hypothetical protein
MYTAKEIDDAITAKYSTYPAEFYDTIERREIYLPSLDEFAEFVKSYEPEKDGSDQWILFKVGGQLFRKYGYYSSWDSPEWDGKLVEVVPREVTVIKYIDKE